MPMSLRQRGKIEGRKVILIPTARPEGLPNTVRSFIDNAHRHGYSKPIHFVITDNTAPEISEKNEQMLERLKARAKKLGMDNIAIHHIDLDSQRRLIERVKKEGRHMRAIEEFTGPSDEPPSGYGKARNRASVAAFRLGLLDGPKDIGILFDDDINAKNLVRKRRPVRTPRMAKIYGTEPEGSLRLEDTGSYFHRIDELFDNNPKVKIAVGGSTFDGDVPADVVVNTTLDSMENFLSGTSGVKRPKLKKLGETLSRATFARRFHAGQNVDWAVKNLARKAKQSMEGKITVSPHWMSGGEGSPNKVQSVIAAHNMYLRGDVLRRYPFIKTPERGEDSLLVEAVSDEHPGSFKGITNPVAHIKRKGRSSVFSNIRLEYESDLETTADSWEHKADKILKLLNNRVAWWARPQYRDQVRSLRTVAEVAKNQAKVLRARAQEFRSRPRPLVTRDGESMHDAYVTRFIELSSLRAQGKLPTYVQERKDELEEAYKLTFPKWRRMWSHGAGKP